jgi:serine protease Do
VKFATIVGVAVGLAIAFASVVDVPRRPLAAQQPQSEIFRQQRPAPVEAAQPVVDLGNAFAAVAEVVRPAVVYISAQQTVEQARDAQPHPELPPGFERFFNPEDLEPQPRGGSGSGFILSSDGYIMTNNHVVTIDDEPFGDLTVRLFDGREFDAEVVGRDANTDIAIIKIDASDLPTAALGDSEELRVGEWVLAIGTPLGDAFSFTVTAGIVSGRGRNLRLNTNQWAISDFIQTDAAVNPGNSGGPLVNINGQVVGVNSAIASRTGVYAGYSFAIPVNLAKVIGDQLIREGKVTRAALGVQVRNATAADAEYVGLRQVRGVMIVDFASEGSPAERAGLQPEDIIVALDGEPVDYTAQLQQIVGYKRPGETVDVTVRRHGGDERTFTVRLQEAQETEPQQVAQVEPEAQPNEGSYEDKLGIRVEELSDDMMRADRRLNDENRGLVITEVDPSGPARDALDAADSRRGVLPIITHVNGERVRTIEDLERLLPDIAPDEIVSLRLQIFIGRTQQTGVVRYRAGGR